MMDQVRIRHRQRIYDDEDGVIRCPRCTWEMEDETMCERCGYEDGDDSASDELDHDLDLDDDEHVMGMFDDEVDLATLRDAAAAEGFSIGGSQSESEAEAEYDEDEDTEGSLMDFIDNQEDHVREHEPDAADSSVRSRSNSGFSPPQEGMTSEVDSEDDSDDEDPIERRPVRTRRRRSPTPPQVLSSDESDSTRTLSEDEAHGFDGARGSTPYDSDGDDATSRISIPADDESIDTQMLGQGTTTSDAISVHDDDDSDDSDVPTLTARQRRERARARNL